MKLDKSAFLWLQMCSDFGSKDDKIQTKKIIKYINKIHNINCEKCKHHDIWKDSKIKKEIIYRCGE
jgi:hypothetical protein